LTLVEILVVIAIMIVLVGLVLAFYPKREVRNAAEGASQLQSYLAGAKTRALRDQQPVGVRLLTNDNGATFTGAQLVTALERFAPIDPGNNTIFLDLPAGSGITAVTQNTARQVGVPLLGNVEVGDVLEIVEVTPSSHRIVAIDYATNTMRLAAALETFDDGMGNISSRVSGVPNVNCTASARLRNNYRYLRAPRPLMGEQPWQLPRDVVIRGATGIIPSSLNIPTDSKGNWEIRFAPGGSVINAEGRTVLWVEDVNGVAKPTLLVIYPNGAIAAHPVGPPGNEYQFTADGRSSGQ
jgi:type II secretory pathway pseudopilin PulG